MLYEKNAKSLRKIEATSTLLESVQFENTKRLLPSKHYALGDLRCCNGPHRRRAGPYRYELSLEAMVG
jgi:hypothetical protein